MLHTRLNQIADCLDSLAAETNLGNTSSAIGPVDVPSAGLGLTVGYEDLNDHDELRSDPALQTAVGADQLLVSYLRPSKIDGAKHAWAVLALLVKRLRQAWPKVEIVFRGDSGFCRWRMLGWCERHNVDYIVGIARNPSLRELAKPLMDQAARAFADNGEKQCLFDEFPYAAGTWDRSRRVIVKAEYAARGANPRYIVTSLKEAPQYLYDTVYCARGDMENRIKEQQLDLFADRTSCHEWWPNQHRVLLSALAYVLLDAIRRIALADGELARAYVGTIRLKLLKIGAVVLRNTRRVRLLLSSSCPHQALFFAATARLRPRKASFGVLHA